MSAYTKNPVGAGYGLGDWLLQRITAVVMAVYSLWMAGIRVACRPSGHAGWKAFFEGGMVRIATLVFTAALLYHAWVGVRDIIMDYMKPASVRLVAMMVVALALLAEFFWAAAILWGR